MHTIPLSQAKAHFSAIIERIEAGEEVIITKMGKPVAKIGQVSPAPKRTLLGLYAGHDFKMTDDVDAWPEDIARSLGMID